MNAGLVSPLRAAVLPVLAAAALTLLFYREGPLLSFDGYHYCEFAKLYAIAWPPSFGNHWPCGYPLLGGLLGRLGLPAYPALCLISLLALGALVAMSAHLLQGNPTRLLILCALAAAPVVTVQLGGNLTELPFAAALLGVALALSRWQTRAAWWIAGAGALAALGLRYAGVLVFAAVWSWLALHARRLVAARAFTAAVMATSAASLVAAGLLLWNLRATGYLSGASRAADGPLGLSVWPRQVADLGWSPVSALGGARLRELAGGEGTPAGVAGWGLSLAAGALLLRAATKPRRPWVPAVAFVALAYGVGMTVLRSAGAFDALHNGRVALPALFPAGLVIAAQGAASRLRIPALGAAAALALGAGFAARGVSREIAGDVRRAVPVLRSRLDGTDSIQINDAAFSLAAYFPQRTFRCRPESWRDTAASRFLVLAGSPADRRGTPEAVPPAWRRFADQLVVRGTHRWLLDSPALLVLETVPNPPRP